jgi:hypothetical protein
MAVFREGSMGRWDPLIARLFEEWDQELARHPTLSDLKGKIERAMAEAASDIFQKDDLREPMAMRIDDFTEHLSIALETRSKDNVSYNLMLEHIKQSRA